MSILDASASRSKTYKREVAFIMLVALLYFGYTGSIEVLEILTGPFCLFIGWAYGLDWTGKNAESIKGVIGRGSPDGMLKSSSVSFESRYRGSDK